MVDTLTPDSYVHGADGLVELQIDAGTMYADPNGVRKPRVEKRQRKLAAKITFLKDFLEDGERLLTITTAVSPTSFLEQWTTGLVFIYQKRCLLAITDRRIFHIPTTAGYDYRQSVAEIRYADLASIALKGARLKIACKTGAKETFLYVRSAERKKIRALLTAIDLQGATGTAGGRVHLCPQCTARLEKDRFDCPDCGKAFKSRQKARKLAIWLPGGGYFYTGHPFLGIADAAVELFLLAALVLALIPSSTQPNSDPMVLIFVGLLLVVEKAISVYHADHFVKEYLPADGVAIRRSPARTVLNAVGVVFVLLVAASGIYGVLSDTGYAPSQRVLSAGQMSASQQQDVVDLGILENGEMIEYFYSQGIVSIAESGSILTDARVIVYEQGDDGRINYYYLPTDDIVSVELVQAGDALHYSVYRVSGEGEDNWMHLVLPHEHGDGERFVEAIRARIM